MEVPTSEIPDVYAIINNIPKTFHSSNLRTFFSSFIETGGFACFHYRHRPEVQKPIKKDQCNEDDQCRRKTNCCIVKVVSERIDEFIQKYNGEHWLDDKGETLSSCCYIKKIIFSVSSNSLNYDSSFSKKGTIYTSLPLEQESFSNEDVNSLIEMHPPTFMPNGNVGTKTEHFLNEIRACRLPPSLIAKLGLQFPRNRSKRIYGCVPLEYKTKSKNTHHSSRFEKVVEHETSTCNKRPWCSREPIPEEDQDEKKDSESESEEEEWDRVEALHNDVSGQERDKERLFENKIELKWEKGGSGLVFYTDAQYWDAKEGDFDAKTADDWDIDTRIYEGATQDTDKDMRDLIKMKIEEKRRSDMETQTDRLYDFAAFERYSRGFGRKLLESQGWKEGLGVGKRADGIPEPLPNDGQHPLDKKGFGYRGEKLNHYPERKRQRRKRNTDDDEDGFFISTIYDNPKETDPPESAFASSSFARLKYRQEFLKEQS